MDRISFLILFMFSSFCAVSQKADFLSSIDSICDRIGKDKVKYVKIKVSSYNRSGKDEWQHFLIDTTEKKFMLVTTRLKNQKNSFRFYIFGDELIRYEERIKRKNGQIDLNCYYMFKGKELTGKIEGKKRRSILTRLKEFIDYRTFVFSQN